MFGPSRFFFPVLWPRLTSGSSLLLRVFFRICLLDASARPPRVLTHSFPLIPAAFTSDDSVQLLGFGFLSGLTLICGLICDFCLSGQRFAHWSTSQLRNPASFRFHLAMNTLAFGYDLPTAGRSRDFHPLECALAGRTKKKTERRSAPFFLYYREFAVSSAGRASAWGGCFFFLRNRLGRSSMTE